MRQQKKSSGKKSYIRYENAKEIESYCAGEKIDFSEAVNQIIATFFERNRTANAQEEFNSLKRKIEYLTLIIQPCLLELIERSGELRTLTQLEPKAQQFGRQSRDQFEDLFMQMISRVKEKYHVQ
jgi:hypothetical protein